MYDLVIKNARILDGTGNPCFPGSLAVQGQEIAWLGAGKPPPGKLRLDAENHILCPGFIDIHTHSDFTVLQCPTSDSKIFQGVTTELAGHCGYSLFPINPSTFDGLKKFTAFMPGQLDWQWDSVQIFLDRLEKQGLSTNFQTLVGQGALRIAVMGFGQREADQAELAAMRELLARCLDQGAAGMSMGLVYAPGSFASKTELLALAEVIRSKDKMLTAHIRDEGDRVEEALRELLEITEATGVKTQVCHLKAQGRLNWPKMDRLIHMIEETRAKGFDLTFDVYAYTKLNTLLTALLPAWAQDGGVDTMLARFADYGQRSRLLPELAPIALKYGGWENITVASVNAAENASVEGCSLAQIAADWGLDPAEAMLELLIRDKCAVMAVCDCMEESNVIKALIHPLSMLCSDGKILSRRGVLAQGKPHPRNYGAFPRLLARYVRELGVLTLPDAIRRMTSLPAQKMGLWDRGLLRPGLKADLVVFDENTIQDTATFTEPHQYAAGIDYVIVNGVLTVDKGRHTGALAGQILR